MPPLISLPYPWSYLNPRSEEGNLTPILLFAPLGKPLGEQITPLSKRDEARRSTTRYQNSGHSYPLNRTRAQREEPVQVTTLPLEMLPGYIPSSTNLKSCGAL